MGDLSRISRDVRRSRAPRVLAVAGIVAAAVAGAVACQPTDGELNVTTVSVTTEKQATEELNRQHADVAWISCKGTYTDGSGTPGSSSPSEVTVDCDGKTKDGKDITIKGWVYGVVPDKCVRGNLIARVDDKVWFHLQVLGNCAASDTATPTYTPEEPPKDEPPNEEPPNEEPPKEEPPQDEPTEHEPTEHEPPQDEPQPGPTQTVTETVTVPEPDCSCPQDK
ncbi:hypothetical protein [Streptomyces sp. NPDC050264]|uniref:hypothetical protein n=1 Tax=Streptomyces sp. NPDC050264 TaxID=3155038 RepID=UPI00343D43D2